MMREALIKRIRAGVLAACDDVSGIVLFGSFARGEPAHDVDVLVVVRETGKPQREQEKQVIAIGPTFIDNGQRLCGLVVSGGLICP